MPDKIKLKSYNLACRNYTLFLHTHTEFVQLWVCVCSPEHLQAAAITSWTKWDFQHFLNYHGAAVAIHLIQLQFLRSNPIKNGGARWRRVPPRQEKKKQNTHRNFLWNNRQWRPHQESEQFQNSHYRRWCPARAPSASIKNRFADVNDLFSGWWRCV